METNLTKEYVQKNLEKTKTALSSVYVLPGGEKLFEMIQRYISDASYFLEKGEVTSSFGAIEYAHGLLDAGVYLKLFKVLKNKELFVFSD